MTFAPVFIIASPNRQNVALKEDPLLYGCSLMVEEEGVDDSV